MPEYFSLGYVEDQMGEAIRGVIHIGAHHAEERDDYHTYGLPVYWVEGHPEYAKVMFENLKGYPEQLGAQLLLSDVDDEEVDFWITADEYASSMLKPALHQEQNPHAYTTGSIKLNTTRFDTFVRDCGVAHFMGQYNLLVLDVQGAETKVWKGMGIWQDQFKAIISEYSTVEFYEGVPRLEELDATYEGFTRVYPDEPLMHGDALYVRK
jgi:hypothetical protein